MTSKINSSGELIGYRKNLGNGWYAAILPMLFNHRIIVTDGVGVSLAWCYSSETKAIRCFNAWDGKGDPKEWHKNPMTGEYRKEEHLKTE
jgi:hypothetical protein